MIINHSKGGTGAVGKDGTTPHIGANGNWFLGETDTGVAAQGKSDTRIETIILPVADWDSDTLSQAITCTGVLEDETKQIITTVALPGNEEVCETCHIVCSAFAKDTLTFTAAELPSADVYIYVILENVSGGDNVSNSVYSTEETVVGTWIDGKPIYRKSVPFGAITIEPGKVVYVAYETDFSNDIDQKVSLSAKADYALNNSRRFETLPSTKVSLRFVGTGINIYNTDDSSLTNLSGVVIFEYTKTTDTATIAIPSATAMAEAYDEGVNEA